MQTGTCQGHCGPDYYGNTLHYYLEYQDYTYSIPGSGYAWKDQGVATGTGNVEFTVWSDGTGGDDQFGHWFNTYVNINTGPNNTSPIWITRLSENWTYQAAEGEVYNSTTVNEPMGNACFGCTSFNSQFLDLGWYSSGSTTWGIWDPSYDPGAIGFADPPYTYTPHQPYYWFTVD